MRKTISKGILIFLLITYTFSFNSFAESQGKTIKVNITEKESSEVTVIIGFDNQTEICGGNFTFWYNNEKLKILETKQSETGTTVQINNNYNSAGNLIRGSFFAATPIKNGQNLVAIKFKVLNVNVDSSDFNIKEYRLYDENSKPISDEKKVAPIITLTRKGASDGEGAVTDSVENAIGEKSSAEKEKNSITSNSTTKSKEQADESTSKNINDESQEKSNSKIAVISVSIAVTIIVVGVAVVLSKKKLSNK